ncbi:hypothetical protein C5167_011162 [Papaver somniferum]|uniref:O-fucosyltransferase family protein n=1 Tax=Papaver somniferum TaxID=3469 RepID=A0A4Y7K3H0_PAPSO|nr:hypothetical protein C5167_011162 [Papaver somniferum]
MAGDVFGRRGNRQLKQLWGLRGLLERLSVALIVLLICCISLFTTFKSTSNRSGICSGKPISVDELWETAASGGWRPSSAPRSDWPPPPVETNGYLRVRCNGGLNQQRTGICNAVLAARIMDATLVLPELDANAYWNDNRYQIPNLYYICKTGLEFVQTCKVWAIPFHVRGPKKSILFIFNHFSVNIEYNSNDTLFASSGFHGIYDVEHFIKSLRYDVRIVETLSEISKHGKSKKLKAHQIRPPRDAPVSWYKTVALKAMKEHGAIYLTPFSHRLEEEIDNAEYQRLRCRVNYHALRFKPQIMKLSQAIVSKLRSQGHFMSIHLRFEMDMLSFAGCFDIFTPAEQKILKKYREENFAPKELVYDGRRAIGKCPLTPEEASLCSHPYHAILSTNNFSIVHSSASIG